MLPRKTSGIQHIKIPLAAAPDLVLTRETRITSWEVDLDQDVVLVSYEEVLVPRLELQKLIDEAAAAASQKNPPGVSSQGK